MRKIFIYLIVLMCVHCTVHAQMDWTETAAGGACATGAIVNTGLNAAPGDQFVFGPDGSLNAYGAPCTVHIDSWTIDVSGCTGAYDFGTGNELIVELLVDGLQVFEGPPSSGISLVGGVLDVEAWFTANGYGYGPSTGTWEVIVAGLEQQGGAACAVDLSCDFTVACAVSCSPDCTSLTGGGTTCENQVWDNDATPGPIYPGDPGTGGVNTPTGDNSGTGCWTLGQFSDPLDQFHVVEAGNLSSTSNSEVYTFCSEFTATGTQAQFPTYEVIFGDTGGCFGSSTISIFDSTGCVDQTGNGVTITQPIIATSSAGIADDLVIGTDYVICYELDFGAGQNIDGTPCTPLPNDGIAEFCLDIVMQNVVLVCPTMDFVVPTDLCPDEEDYIIADGPNCGTPNAPTGGGDPINLPATGTWYDIYYEVSANPVPSVIDYTDVDAGDWYLNNSFLTPVVISNFCGGPYNVGPIVNNTCDPIYLHLQAFIRQFDSDLSGDGFLNEIDASCGVYTQTTVVYPDPQPAVISGGDCSVILTAACPGQDVITVTGGQGPNGTVLNDGTDVVEYVIGDGDLATNLTYEVGNAFASVGNGACDDEPFSVAVTAYPVSTVAVTPTICDDYDATVSGDLLVTGTPTPATGEIAYGSVCITINSDAYFTFDSSTWDFSGDNSDLIGNLISTGAETQADNIEVEVCIDDIPLNTGLAPLGTFTTGGSPNVGNSLIGDIAAANGGAVPASVVPIVYTFNANDDYGDGWQSLLCWGEGADGTYEIVDNNDAGNNIGPTVFVENGTGACGGAGTGAHSQTENVIISIEYVVALQDIGVFSGPGTAADDIAGAAGPDIHGNSPANSDNTPDGNSDYNDGVTVFDHVAAGPGEHAITYTFTDRFGCVDLSQTYIDVYESPVITVMGEPECSDDETTYSMTFDITNVSTATWNALLDAGAVGSDLTNTPAGADDPLNPPNPAGPTFTNDGVNGAAFAGFTVTASPSGTTSTATINADGTITVTDIDIADLLTLDIGLPTENNGCIAQFVLGQPVECPFICNYDLIGAQTPICESDLTFTVQVTSSGNAIDETAVVGATWTVEYDDGTGFVALTLPSNGISVDANGELVFEMNNAGTYTTPAGDYLINFGIDGLCEAGDIVRVVESIDACSIDFSTVAQNECFNDVTFPITLPNTLGGIWYDNGIALATDEFTATAAGTYALTYVVGEDLCQTECTYYINILDCDCPLDVAGIQTVCDNAGGTFDVIVTVAGGAATGYNVNGVPTDISSGQFTVNFPQGNGAWTILLTSDDALCDYTLQGEEPECCTLPIATIDDATTCVGSNGQFNLTSLFNGADGGGIFFIDPFDATANPVSPATAPAVDPANGTISVVGDVITYIPGSVTAETTVDVAYSVGVAGCASLDYATVTLVPQPVVDIDFPSSICLGDTLLLTDYVVVPTTGYDVMAWTSTAGTIDAVAGTFIPDAVGNVTICYSETVTSTDGSTICAAEDCEVLGITSSNADLGEDVSVCAGSNGFYNLTSFLINGTTDFGGVFSTTSTDGTLAGNIFTYDAETTDTLTADIIYTICNNSDTVVLTILPAPIVDLDITSCICLGETDVDLAEYLVAPTTGLGTGVWTANAGTIDPATGIYTPAAVGKVTICYEETVTDGIELCTAIDCEVLCIEDNPVATINPVVVCADQCAVDLTQMLDVLATTGGVFSAPNMEFTVAGDVLSCTVGAINAETVIDIEYSVGTPDGCADIQTSTITLVPSPVVDIDLPSSICLGDTLLLTDYVVDPTTGYDVIAWTSTAGTIDAVAGTFIPDAVGNVTICYSETVTSTDGSTICAAEDCEVLGVTSNNADLGEDVTVCAGSNGFYNLTSFFINGDTDLGGIFSTTSTDGTVAGNVFTYDAETTDTLIADIIYTVCNNSDTATLTILPAPVADLDLPSAFCNEEMPILQDYIVDVTTEIGVVWTVADAAGNDISGIIQADGSLDLTGLDENITICYTQTTTVNGTTCDDTDCEVVLIYPAIPADLIIDGVDNVTYCIDDFRDNEVIDLTMYLNDGVGGSGFFTITHSDGTIATDCIDGPSSAGCLDGFIWTLDTLDVGTITITYTTNNDQQTCPFTESITITLIEPATDCLNVPSIVCENEADELIDASGEWYDASCGDCIKTWNSVTDGAQDAYSIETYTNQAAGTYNPNSIPGCTTFVDPGMATNSVTLPQVPTGATILSFDLTWDYQPTCEIAEGDIDTAYISMPDGSIIELYANAGGPGENGNDHFGSQTVSYAWDGTTFASDGNPLFPATIDPVQFTSCAAQPVVSYFLGSNAANFTIGFEANITWATCVFEAYLHETVDADGNQIAPIQIPNATYGITAGFIDNGDGTWSFDANGLDTFGEVDILFYEVSCGTCIIPQVEIVIFVNPVGADTKDGTVCIGDGMIDLTQFLVSGSDNGGNFTATTDSVDASIMGDIIDLATAGVGCHTITYTLQDGVANGCGVAQDEFILCIEASGDATGITFAPFYCEGADVTLPGTAGGSWSYVDATGTTVTLAEGDVINTAGMSALNPLQATYTVGSGDCADSETYLIIIESSYNAVLAPNVAACESAIDGALIMNSNGCIDMDQFVLPNASFGAGYWQGSAGLSGAIFCPTGPGSYDFTFTVPGSGDCGAVRTFNITINPDADASFDIETIVCAADGNVDLSILTSNLLQTWTGQVCVSGGNVEVVSPSFASPDSATLVLPAIPNGALITDFTLDYNYIAGPGNPNANGDLDLYSITTPDGTVLTQWLDNAGPLGNDNHFDFGSDILNYNDVDGNFAFDVNSLIGCQQSEIDLAVVSNSAYWDACIDVSLTWTTGEFNAYLSETGETLAEAGVAGGVSYDGAGAYSLDVSSMCEINDITIEFTRFDCFCEASFTDQIEVLCGADASLAEGTTICYTDDLDLTQFFTDATTTGGTWSGEGVQGNTLVPSTNGGTYTVTYTVGSNNSPCGTATADVTITVAPSLDAAWDAPGSVCLNESYDLAFYITGTMGGSFSGSADIAGTMFTPTTTGLVNITYSVTSGDCTEGWTEVINVIGEETATINTTLTACDSDDPIDISGALLPTPEGGSWSGAGVAGGWFNPTNLNGTYTLTYTVGEGSCLSSTTTTVTVTPGPDASWTSPVEVCADMPSFNLNNYVSGNGGGTWSSSITGVVDTDGTFNPGAAGTDADNEMVFIQVTYSVTEGTCTDTETEVIAVAYVDSYFDMPASACVGDIVTLTANVGGHWWSSNLNITDNGDGTASFEATTAGAYNVTYATGGLICHKTYTATITICDVPAVPQVGGEGFEVCEGGELGMITVAGASNDPLVDGSVFSFFEYYTVTYNGTTYPGQIYYGQELTFDPMAILGDDFTGTASLEIASVNQCGCSSDAVIIDITVHPTPVVDYVLGCTDPQSNLAALEVQGLIEPFQIAVYPEGEELTAMSYNPINDELAIISAGEVYNITIIDANECTATLEGVVAEFAVDFEASISCIDDNGMVSVSIVVDENTGYGSPYEYSYDGGLTYTSNASMTLSAVANPNISVAVRDQKGCLSGFQTFTLGDNGSLAPTATCADANGMVTIDLGYSGTNFNAFYNVDGGADVALTSTVFDLAVSSASTITFTVIDNSSSATGGCELTGELTVYPMLDLIVNLSSDCPIGGVATSITANGGNSPFALTINGEDAGSFSAVAIETLMPGDYTFGITDASGCTASQSITITDVIVPIPTLVYTASYSSATSVCGGEELTLEVTGGSSYVWAVDGVTQLETGNLFIATYDESKLITVAIMDASGCVGEELEIPVTFYPALDNTEPTVVCNGDGTYTVSFGISGGNVAQPYFVEANGIVFENFGTVSATYNLDVPYSFNITSPESGCSLLVSGSDACEDPNLGQGCNPILTQGNLNCDNGEVTITVTNAGSDFDVLGITGGASTDVNVASDGFGTVVVSFTLDASNTGTYTMNYNPGGNGCAGTIDFPISIDCNSVTAIELVRFEGEVLDAGNNLSWITANEVDSEFFTVERSLNGNSFQAIGTVAAKGNTSASVNYNFLDVDAPTGISYYRLVETDVNGLARIVSDIVNLTRDTNNGFGVVNVYPVPTSNTVTIEFTTLNTDDSVIANIFDITGKLVDVINYDTNAGVNEMNVSVADYAAGSYFVTLIQGNQVTNTKFIKK